MLNVLFVAIGGAIGAALRHLVGSLFQSSTYPYATLTVNLIGSFAIGLLMGWFINHAPQSTRVQLFLVTGLLGGFTTFSSFAYENWQHIDKGHLIHFISYFLISNIGGILLALLGYSLITTILK